MIKLPAGVTAIYTNHNTGSDATGDGSLANPFKTAQHAMYWASDKFRWSGGDTTQSIVEVRTADGVNDSSGIHFAPHAFRGAQGGYAMRLLLGSGSQLINSTGDVLGLYFNASLNIETRPAVGGEVITLATIASGAGSCFAVSHGAHLYLGNVRLVQAFGGAGVMVTGGGASVELTGDIEIAGDFNSIVSVLEGAQFASNGHCFAIKANSSWATGFVFAYGGRASFAGTINVGGFATIGQKYNVAAGGAVYAPSNPNTYFPGSMPGTVNAGAYANTYGFLLPAPI